MGKTTTFLLDANALCYRSFYAIKDLTNSKGQPTNAVYGFINTLRKILREFKPDYLAVCYDSPEKTLREKQFADYKIQRPKMPDDLISQIPIIKEVVRAYNLAGFEMAGYEADDIIATLAWHIAKNKEQVVIVSDDKDMYQLMDKNITFYSARQGAMMDQKAVEKKLGFDPARIVDFIGLAGDKVDNIPGVMGVGEVTARSLIHEFGTLENILKHVGDINPVKVREKIQAQKEQAVLSKQLAVLHTNVPVAFTIDDLKVGAENRGRLFEIFKELEFNRLSNEYAEATAVSQKVSVREVQSKEDAKAVAREVKDSGVCPFLIVQRDGDLYDAISFAISLKDHVYVVKNKVLAELKGALEDEGVLKITYDLKAALRILAGAGICVRGPVFDVMLAGYLINPTQAAIQLSNLAWQYLEQGLAQDKPLEHTAVLAALHDVISKELAAKELMPLFNDIEMPLAHVLAMMEEEGVTLDLGLLKTLSKDCESRIHALVKKLYAMAGEEFNLNSPKQLGHILFDKLGLPTLKKTKTGFSTDEGVLTKLALGHEFPAFILEYRQLAKLKSTYIDALPKMVDASSGKIHAEFNQTGTETGRLSSSKPNLQNIPIRTDLGRQIRKAIIASSPERSLLAADYSQIELRILAHLSQDKNLIKAFEEDRDIHTYTASLVFDVAEKDVTAHMRDSAKRVNFGIVYGMSAFGLSKDLSIPMDEAQVFIDKYFLRYPGVKEFMDREIKFCESNGYVKTLFNRRRYIPDIKSKNIGVRQFAQRQAINTPVQGSAADLIKLVMIKLSEMLTQKKFSSKMIITVHDELVFDVDPKEQKTFPDEVRQVMEHSVELLVPVKVSMKSGKNWMEMKEI